MLKYQDLMRGIRQGQLLPLYLFFGEEEFLIQEAIDGIAEKAVDPASRDFNAATLYCRETPAADLVSLAQTLPFLGEKRLIIAREIEAYKAADVARLLPYLADPAPHTCLVLIASQSRFDKKQVIDAVEKQGAVVRFYPLLDREIVPWIEGRARARGGAIDREAAQYLWQTVGNDLQKIVNELEKIELYQGGKKTVTVAAVKAAAGDFREYSSFDLAAAVGRKDRGQSLVILSRLLQEGEAPIGLLAAIAWNFRRLVQAKALEAKGMGADEIVKRLRIIFHQAGQFKEQMRRYSAAELRDAIGALVRTDRLLKSGGLPGRLLLERMILELCGV